MPRADFRSYYGLPVLNPPWAARDIAGYLFLGGLAGASSLLGAGAQLTGRRRSPGWEARRGGRCGAGASRSSTTSAARPVPAHAARVQADVADERRLLAAGGLRAAGRYRGRRRGHRPAPRIGAAATAAAAVLGPAVATYTAALIADTAVPAWHDGHRELPYVFVGSAATAAGGLGLLAAPLAEHPPARTLAVLGVAGELAAFETMTRRLGMVGEPYRTGPGGHLINAGKALAVGGALGAVLGRRHRVAAALSGAALLAASACTRFGIFHAGLASARDPRYTVEPQRERLRRGPA